MRFIVPYTVERAHEQEVAGDTTKSASLERSTPADAMTSSAMSSVSETEGNLLPQADIFYSSKEVAKRLYNLICCTVCVVF